MFALRALRVGLGHAVYGALRASQIPAIGRLTLMRSFSRTAPALLATAAKKTPAKKKTTTTTTKKTAAAKKKPASKTKTKAKTKVKARAKPKARTAAKRPKTATKRKAARRTALTSKERAERQKAARAKKTKAELAALPKPPKRAPSGYALFIKQQPAGTGYGPEYIRKVAAQWSELPETEKAKYYAQSQALRPVVQKNFERWAAQVGHLAVYRINARLRRKGKSPLPKVATAPELKAPLAPFLRYFRSFRLTPEAAALSAMEQGRKAGQNWRALSDAEKRPYIDAWQQERTAWLAKKSA